MCWLREVLVCVPYPTSTGSAMGVSPARSSVCLKLQLRQLTDFTAFITVADAGTSIMQRRVSGLCHQHEMSHWLCN